MLPATSILCEQLKLYCFDLLFNVNKVCGKFQLILELETLKMSVGEFKEFLEKRLTCNFQKICFEMLLGPGHELQKFNRHFTGLGCLKFNLDYLQSVYFEPESQLL